MAAISTLGLYGAPLSLYSATRYNGKTVAANASGALLVWQFDIWREGYAGAVVQIFKEGTTSPASLYSDINLSTPVTNPQVLISEDLNGRSFGKFLASIYTPDAYYLVINSIQSTGVSYPGIRSLQGQDGSDEWVTSDKGGVERTAGQRAGDAVHVRDFGNFLEVDGSTTENTTTLVAAIGVAASFNGGEVILPAGTFKISTINLPADVVLRGQGRNASIIQSAETGNIVTVTGDHAGMQDMCLDGINLQPGSIGVYALHRETFRLTEVNIKRFETGMKCVGGLDHHYTNLFVDNCATNVWLRGDSDVSSTNLGGNFSDLTWQGGALTDSTLYGLRLTYQDQPIQNLTIRDVTFTDNVGTAAFSIEGAQSLILEDLVFSGNIVRHLLTADAVGSVFQNAEFRSCEFTDREIKLGGSCKDVVFDRPLLAGTLSLNANGPGYPVMFRDAVEATTVTQTGNTDKISRWASVDYAVFKGQTTATVTTAVVFKRILASGELVHLEVMATALQKNLAAFGSLKKTAAAYLGAGALSYVSQTANFTAGNTVTAVPSGASGIIQSQVDGGASGTINVIRVSGTFANNDVLTDSGGGNGVVQGAIVLATATMIAPVQLDHYAQIAGSTTWDVDVTTSGQEVRVVVKGVTTGVLDWNVMVRQNRIY